MHLAWKQHSFGLGEGASMGRVSMEEMEFSAPSLLRQCPPLFIL